MRYELFEGRTRLSKLGMGAMRLPQTAPGRSSTAAWLQG